MKYKVSFIIFMILLPLSLNIVEDISDLIYDDVLLNDKTENKIVTVSISGLRIFTEIEKSSEIEVTLTSDKIINKTNIYYDRAKDYKILVFTERNKKPTILTKGNSHRCYYYVKKEDDYKYGVLIIEGLGPLFQLTVSVSVYTKLKIGVIIAIVAVALIILIVGIVVICRKCFRCSCCCQKKIML